MQKVLTASSLKQIPVGSAGYFAEQKRLIRTRTLLHHCYMDWFARMKRDADSVANPGHLVELGSGGSLLSEVIPDAITSDVVEGVADQVIDARELPFEDRSVKALFLIHVFHHIPEIRRFLREASRVLVPGGVISMIEVSHTPLARLLFSRFHPEPYDDEAAIWEFDQSDPMADSNQALSWMIFARDQENFRHEFPEFTLETKAFTPWFSYLVSGGVSKTPLVPEYCSGAVLAMDRVLDFLSPVCSLHWHLCLRKSSES